MTVIIGFDIKILSPAYDSLKNNDSYLGNFQQMSIFPRQGAKFIVEKKSQQQSTGPGA